MLVQGWPMPVEIKDLKGHEHHQPAAAIEDQERSESRASNDENKQGSSCDEEEEPFSGERGEVHPIITALNDVDEKHQELQGAINSFINLDVIKELLKMRRTIVLLKALDVLRLEMPYEAGALWSENVLNPQERKFLLPNITSCPILSRNQQGDLITVIPSMIPDNVKVTIPRGVGINTTETQKIYHSLLASCYKRILPLSRYKSTLKTRAKRPTKHDLQPVLEDLYEENPEDLLLIQDKFSKIEDKKLIDVKAIAELTASLNPPLEAQAVQYEKRFYDEFHFSIEDVESAVSVLKNFNKEMRQRYFFRPESSADESDESEVGLSEKAEIDDRENLDNYMEVGLGDRDERALASLKEIFDQIRKTEATVLLDRVSNTNAEKALKNISNWYKDRPMPGLIMIIESIRNFLDFSGRIQSELSPIQKILQKADQFEKKDILYRDTILDSLKFMGDDSSRISSLPPVKNSEEIRSASEALDHETEKSLIGVNELHLSDKRDGSNVKEKSEGGLQKTILSIREKLDRYMESRKQAYQLIVHQIKEEQKVEQHILEEATKAAAKLAARVAARIDEKMFVKRPF